MVIISLMRINLLFLFLILFISDSYAKTHTVSLSEKIEFNSGDIITLKDSLFSVEIGSDPGTTCAVPGFNCGSGYSPPSPTYLVKCGEKKLCPYVLMTNQKNATSGNLSIEDETSCEKNDPENCFSQFARYADGDTSCMNLISPLGRYYCLKRFEKSARPENKGLCEKLPESIYALKWNCYYEYAVRYRDASFCNKYSQSERSGRDRCLLQMATILNDQSLCDKMSGSKEDTYLEQCRNLKIKK